MVTRFTLGIVLVFMSEPPYEEPNVLSISRSVRFLDAPILVDTNLEVFSLLVACTPCSPSICPSVGQSVSRLVYQSVTLKMEYPLAYLALGN